VSTPLRSVLDIVEVAEATERPLETVMETYFALGSQFVLTWLRDRIIELPRRESLAPGEPPRQLLGQPVEIELCAVSFVAKARRFSGREMSQREPSEAKARNRPLQGQRPELR